MFDKTTFDNLVQDFEAKVADLTTQKNNLDMVLSQVLTAQNAQSSAQSDYSLSYSNLTSFVQGLGTLTMTFDANQFSNLVADFENKAATLISANSNLSMIQSQVAAAQSAVTMSQSNYSTSYNNLLTAVQAMSTSSN